MSEDFAALQRRMTALSTALGGDGVKKITGAVALKAKKDALGELAKSPVGADRKFTNWKPKLNVGYELTSDHEAEVKPRPSGPWKVATDGRWPGHKYSRKAKRKVGWGPTKGWDVWTKATRTIEDKTPQRVHEEVTKVMTEVFR